jgi:DNA-binding IclR family transcriptional regulator
MESTKLPMSVIAFLRTHVDHIVKLKFLVTLHCAPGGATSVSLVARALDVPKSQVRDMAAELADDNLVRVSTDHLELAPTSIDDRLAIADLASWYERDRGLVLDVLRALGRAGSSSH